MLRASLGCACIRLVWVYRIVMCRRCRNQIYFIPY
nr:MAG TPA: hypothetical protein [Bacteriophage sp.]